ncbi:hypothetical protein Hypma_014681 [Hypsizygus marmoreus]|uniref:Uncharacterized protein n=1 Tax=Hypsizygus marmoreus TaxID=39966 RepID=A0A369JIU5_HYPMA|nr:hypothetical protein Hypma_014681 [Hypsizygus marmoreus]
MASEDPSSSSISLAQERACFDGTFVSTLAYGALLMLYFQLTQVLLSRPNRGRMYWAIVAYSSILFPLATIAIGGLLKFTELAYVDHHNDPGGPVAFYTSHLTNRIHVLSQVSITLVPWIGDILMLYRVMVVWNYKRWIVIFPGLLYISRVAMSIPLLISQTRPKDTGLAAKSPIFSTVFYSLCVSLNLFVTIMISARLYMMRKKVETIMGKLHASFYTGFTTILVESGAFFTIWALTYVILMSLRSPMKEVFLLPYTHVLGITRMLIVLRMAQDRAWSKELATATASGVLDWQVSSTHSIPLHDVPASSEASLPRKYREDSL